MYLQCLQIFFFCHVDAIIEAAVITDDGYDTDPHVLLCPQGREPSGRLVARSAWLPAGGRLMWSTVYTPLIVNGREMAAKYKA